MIMTIKINKEIKIQKCEHNGIKIILNLKGKHKTDICKLNENEVELLNFGIIILKK